MVRSRTKKRRNHVKAEISGSDPEEKGDKVDNVFIDTVGWLQQGVAANTAPEDNVDKRKKFPRHEHPDNKDSPRHQLFIQFRGGKRLKPHEIKELHPDIISVKVFRQVSCGKCIVTFASEKDLKNALPVLKNVKVNDRKLIVRRKEKKRSDLPFLPHTAPRRK